MSSDVEAPERKKRRWGDAGAAARPTTEAPTATHAEAVGGQTPQMGRAARVEGTTPRQSQRWGLKSPSMAMGGRTPSMSMMPNPAAADGSTTPSGLRSTLWGETPGLATDTPTPFHSATPSQSTVDQLARRKKQEWAERNRFITDEELDRVLPTSGYTIVQPPAMYHPIVNNDLPNFHLLAAEELKTMSQGVSIGQAPTRYAIPDSLGEGLPRLHPIDAPAFELLLKWQYAKDDSEIEPPSELLRVYVQRQLLKVVCGDTNQRRSGVRFLVEKIRTLTVPVVFECVLALWRHLNPTSEEAQRPEERHFLVKLTKRLIDTVRGEVVPHTRDIIMCMESLLSDSDGVAREDGKDIVELLANSVGLHAMYEAIRHDILSESDGVRRHTAKVVAIIAQALGPQEAMVIIKSIAPSASFLARHTCAKAIFEMAALLGFGVSKVLPALVPLLHKLLEDEHLRVRMDAALALAQVAESVSPYGIEHLQSVVGLVCSQCRMSSGRGRMLASFLRALGALIPLMNPADAQRHAQDIMPSLIIHFQTPDDELRRTVLKMVQQCVSSEGVSAEYIRKHFMGPFFEGMWSTRRAATDRRTYQLLVEATVEIATKVGGSLVLDHIVPAMTADFDQAQKMVVDAVHQVVKKSGTLDLSPTQVTQLMEGAMGAFRMEDSGFSNTVVLQCLSTVCQSLGTRCKGFVPSLLALIQQRLDNGLNLVRQQAADLLANIAPVIHECTGETHLIALGDVLFHKLNDDQATSLAAVIGASRRVLECVGPTLYRPSVKELLKKTKFLLKNPDSAVQLQTVELVHHIAVHAASKVETLDLQQVALGGLFALLDSPRRQTRRRCADTFGVIAGAIWPFYILMELVHNFRQDKRRPRICTAVALSVIAKICKPFTVVPFLINEYRACESTELCTTIQHSILKAVRFMFEEMGPLGRDYVYPLLPLLECALTEADIQHRRMGAEAARSMILAVASQDGLGDAVVHILNFIHPNLVELLSRKEPTPSEERLKMISAAVGVYEAARLVVGSSVLVQYLVQGLFHPARKVRDIYWRTYNLVYIGNPEGMVPMVKRLRDVEESDHALLHLLV